jgi:hypothetical protein
VDAMRVIVDGASVYALQRFGMEAMCDGNVSGVLRWEFHVTLIFSLIHD